ncbi:purine and uridine phosphorylase [Gonapodya prolifera JEL478]|uniref:Purine and uridine phosphorylase n=1 Tax=Gonapodya prolifera (strain JEL478) TaxID=1344416 RepID=A0A138ZYL9_GONPJ|nr:purine and uridine phosphorylase [Gonapodya prolifera JEL478]|eukprot:KXS09602.1 purine and uridine phosphorylase [Gonapodya prolifera JEL478]
MRVILALCLALVVLATAHAESDHVKLRRWTRSQYLELSKHFDTIGREEHRERLSKRNNWNCPKIGILSAFAPETLSSLQVMNASGYVRVLETNGRQFFEGTLRGKQVVISTTGVGMSNAAMTTQMVFELYPSIEYLIFSGIAGGVNPALPIGSVTIPKKWSQYQHNKFINNQVDASIIGEDFPNTFYRYNDTDGKTVKVAYMEPSYKNCGNETLTTNLTYPGFAVPMMVDTLVNASDAFASVTPQQFWFPVDEYLLNATERALPKLPNLTATGFDPINQKNFTLPDVPHAQIGEAGLSASTFLDNADLRAQLFGYFKADAVDMESATVMHVCKSNQKKCIVIRSLSDLAGGQEGTNVILTFTSFAAKNSATVLFSILDEMEVW